MFDYNLILIFIYKQKNKINNPLLSRFINIRMPLHNLTDKYIYFKELLNKNTLNI